MVARVHSLVRLGAVMAACGFMCCGQPPVMGEGIRETERAMVQSGDPLPPLPSAVVERVLRECMTTQSGVKFAAGQYRFFNCSESQAAELGGKLGAQWVVAWAVLDPIPPENTLRVILRDMRHDYGVIGQAEWTGPLEPGIVLYGLTKTEDGRSASSWTIQYADKNREAQSRCGIVPMSTGLDHSVGAPLGITYQGYWRAKPGQESMVAIFSWNGDGSELLARDQLRHALGGSSSIEWPQYVQDLPVWSKEVAEWPDPVIAIDCQVRDSDGGVHGK